MFSFPFFFIFHVILSSFKETLPIQLFPGAIPWRGINTENSDIRGSKLKSKQTSLLDQCQPSSTRWSRTSIPLCDYLWDRKSWSPTNYFLYGVFDPGSYESVKMLITLFWFLQNSRSRSCFKGFLMPPIRSYVML